MHLIWTPLTWNNRKELLFHGRDMNHNQISKPFWPHSCAYQFFFLTNSHSKPIATLFHPSVHRRHSGGSSRGALLRALLALQLRAWAKCVFNVGRVSSSKFNFSLANHLAWDWSQRCRDEDSCCGSSWFFHHLFNTVTRLWWGREEDSCGSPSVSSWLLYNLLETAGGNIFNPDSCWSSSGLYFADIVEPKNTRNSRGSNEGTCNTYSRQCPHLPGCASDPSG